MLTDADMGGVERITVSTLRPQFNAKPRHSISLDDLNLSADGHSDNGLIPPHGLFIVKGWSRMVCCYTIMAAAFENPEILKARLPDVLFQWVQQKVVQPILNCLLVFLRSLNQLPRHLNIFRKSQPYQQLLSNSCYVLSWFGSKCKGLSRQYVGP